MLRTTKPPKCKLTIERAAAVLSYEPETGLFRWKVKVRFSVPGEVAGRIKDNGYVAISVDGDVYYAHRLAWLFSYGGWPGALIDHIDGDKTNNRIANLREVTKQVNAQNLKGPHVGNETGFLGVTPDKKAGGFKAIISHGGRRHWIGRFATPEEAHAAYVQKKRELHEGCTL
jgi:hypothetical protein